MITALLSLTILAAKGEGKIAFEAWETKLVAAKSLSGTLKIDAGEDSDVIRFRLAKPNMGEVETKKYHRYSDGRQEYVYLPALNSFQKKEAVRLPSVSPLFFGFETFTGQDRNFKFEKEETAKFEGADVYAVVFDQLPGRLTSISKYGAYGPGLHLTLYFDLQTKALRGFELNMPEHPIKGTYEGLAFDQPMDPKTFAWTPPADAKPYQPTIELEKKLLPVGAKLPDFTLKTHEGKTIKLSEYVKGRKAVLLNFYFMGCGGCLVEFPHLERRYRELKDKGFGVIALNPLDDDKTILKYYGQGGFTFPTVLSKDTKIKVEELYGVQAYPTNYLVDKDMKIVYRSIAENEDGLILALRKLGLG